VAIEPLTQADLEELWRRILPRGYTRPIEEEADGQGFDVIAALAAIFARVDVSVNRTTQAYYIKPHSTQTDESAMGARRATGSVDVLRAAPTTIDVTLPTGTELQATFVDTNGATQLGPLLRLTAELEMLAGSVGPFAAAIEASRPGFDSNLEAGSVSSFALLGRASIDSSVPAAGNIVENAGGEDVFTHGMVGVQYLRFDTGPNIGETRRIVSAFTQPGGLLGVTVDGGALVAGTGEASVLEHEDLGLSVSQAADTSGGRDAWLDAIGEERDVSRRLAETDGAYLERVCEVEDNISPGAILRICNRILGPLGIGFVFKETRGPGLPGLVLDFDAHDAWDVTSGKVHLDEVCGAVRFFVICVGPSALGEFGAPNDAIAPPNPNALDFLALDGYPAAWAAALGALWQALDQARGGGVCFELIFDPDL
jgi:hypothetical protein